MAAKKTATRKRLTPNQKKTAKLEARLQDVQVEYEIERKRADGLASQLSAKAQALVTAERARDDHYREIQTLRPRANKAEADLSTANRTIDVLRTEKQALERKNLILESKKAMFGAAITAMLQQQ